MVVDLEDIKKSTLVANLIQDIEDLEETPVPVTQVSKQTMEKIMVFLAHMRETSSEPEIEQPLPSNDLSQHVDAWYNTFISEGVDQAMLFDIVLAGNHLDIKPLLKLGSAKIASLIKGKSTEEIRQFFQMDNDFTPEEEAFIAEENQFAAEYF